MDLIQYDKLFIKIKKKKNKDKYYLSVISTLLWTVRNLVQMQKKYLVRDGAMNCMDIEMMIREWKKWGPLLSYKKTVKSNGRTYVLSTSLPV